MKLQRFFVPISLAAAIIITVFARLLDSYNLFLVGQMAILIIVTTALVILMGGAGLLSLSSAAFLGIGAYSTIILTSMFHVPFLLAVPLSAIVGALLGWLVGLVALRVSGFYLAIVTFGFLQIFAIFLKQGGDFTGGGYGLVSPSVSLPLIGELNTDSFALIAVFLAVIAVVGAASLMRSRAGRSWLALRDNTPAAIMQGINVRGMKLRAFALSSAVISVAGAIYGYLLGSASPSSFSVNVSIFHIALVVVGGLTGSLAGAVISPIVLFLIPQLFTELGQYEDLLYASLLLLVLIFLPKGISSAVDGLGKKIWGDMRRKNA